MIQIIGATGSSEYRAAEKIRDAFYALIPDHEDRKDDIRIVVSAKTYGERRQDIDLVVAGHLQRPLKIPRSDVVRKDALLLSFFLTIEVKDHPPHKLEICGQKVLVRYNQRLEDASEQAEQQKYSAKNYIEKNGATPPFIVAVLLLNNFPSENLPTVRHNILGGDFTGQNLLDVIYLGYERKLGPDRSIIQAFGQKNPSTYLSVVSIFTQRLVATRLDRKKIELITQRSFNQQYSKQLGSKLLIIKGPGGTGKTVNLIQLAHYAFRENSKRVLILTYNLSLVADIRRLLALMDMNDDIATPRVSISSVHSFMYDVLCRLKLFPRGGGDFLERYSSLKAGLLDVIDAVQESDVPAWDFVFIDEAQDWPDDERRILYSLYGAQNFVIADGQAQLVRTNQHCDWTVDESLSNQKITLSKSLRLKHDICIFSSRLIDELGVLNWRMEPNVSVYGGRVVLVIGDLLSEGDLISSFVSAAKDDGNLEVDILFCVPPSMVENSNNNFRNNTVDEESIDSSISGKYSRVARRLKSLGFEVWDAVDEDLRHNYPTGVNQLRVVQYDSCRGLEGWTVVNLAIEELYDYKKRSHRPTDVDLFQSEEEMAEKFARNWLAIPMTRAIDTLVINISKPDHWLVTHFKNAAVGCECVEIIELNK